MSHIDQLTRLARSTPEFVPQQTIPVWQPVVPGQVPIPVQYTGQVPLLRQQHMLYSGQQYPVQNQQFGQVTEQSAQLRIAPARDGSAARRPDLSTDTRINDIISENARRGGLVRIDPDSELIRVEEDGEVVPLFPDNTLPL